VNIFRKSRKHWARRRKDGDCAIDPRLKACKRLLNSAINSFLMRHRLYRTLPRIVLIAALLCGLTSCAAWPSAEVNFKPHDKALFERAMSAIWRKRFTVANLTLRTLANIYPDSDYARKAKVVLQDPQIAKCGESWSTDPDCE